MTPNLFALTIGQYTYTGWERVSVQYSATDAARAFAFTLTDRDLSGRQWDFLPSDTPVTVTIDGETVVVGHIDTMSPSFSATEHHIEITGRSKSADLVDGAAMHETGEFHKKTLHDIANDIAPDNLDVSADDDLDPVEYHRLQPGEQSFKTLDRIARRQGLLIMGTANGGIHISKGPTKAVHPPLVEGQNINGGSAMFNDGDRHSMIRVRGQRTFGQLPHGSLRIEGSAADTKMKRRREKVVIAEGDVTADEAQKRAEAQRDRQLGNSVSATVKVLGARDANGVIWQANTLIYVQSAFLRLDMQMAIKSVDIVQDKGGTFASLTLVHPLALHSTAPTGHRTSHPWAAKKPAAEPAPKTPTLADILANAPTPEEVDADVP